MLIFLVTLWPISADPCSGRACGTPSTAIHRHIATACKQNHCGVFGVPKINNFGTGHHSTHISVPKINTFGTGHHNTTIPGTQLPGTRYPGSWDRVPRYQNTFAREAICTTTPPSVLLPWAPTNIDFATHTAVCCNVRKTYYLLYFRYILECQGNQNLGIWGTQNQQFRHWSPQYPQICTKNQHFRYWSPQYHHTCHPVAWYQVPWILGQGSTTSTYIGARMSTRLNCALGIVLL